MSVLDGFDHLERHEPLALLRRTELLRGSHQVMMTQAMIALNNMNLLSPLGEKLHPRPRGLSLLVRAHVFLPDIVW